MSEVYRLSQVAELLGVSVDTARRWADQGRIASSRTEAGHRVVEGADLARFIAERASAAAEPDDVTVANSARNHFPGVVTRVVRDAVVAQVEIQAGPHRVVSLMTREAADELALAPGMMAVAAVKATNVTVELHRPR
jgi:molybdopterin-binding protein